MPNNNITFPQQLAQGVLILDGAMGTMIMHHNLDEKAFRGKEFANHPVNLAGCNDVLSITQPQIIEKIHTQYIEAGADIIETNSFNCNTFSLADYSLAPYATQIATAAARIARKAADDFMRRTPSRKVWVAGSIGPTSKSLTMQFQIEGNTAYSQQLTQSYTHVAQALIAEGVDIILIETVFDTLNAKCAIIAARRAMEITQRNVPLIISATVNENARTLSGITVEAFMAAVEHASPAAIMLNCGAGAEALANPLRRMQHSHRAIGFYPNAGLPDEMGRYSDTPQTMAAKIRPLLEQRMLNIVGGCCGTTPQHISAIRDVVNSLGRSEVARPFAPDNAQLTLSSLEHFNVDSATGLIMVGERCNVAGSRKFLRLVKEGNINEALDIAAAQVEAGAKILDISLDDAMLDSQQEITRFLRALLADNRLAKVPLMIDSASFATLEAGLQCLQGRAVVNSISLKEGQEKFVQHAQRIKELGAIPVVMAFDEKGQATTTPRRQEIFTRVFNLLTSPQVGFQPHELIFDPNILTVCTGMPEHDTLAREFVESVRWIKQSFPGVKVSGGLSNLSFAFRGNNTVREAMHAVFLQHAAQAGMDMAIVNPSAIKKPAHFPATLVEAIQQALFSNPSPKATEHLIDIAHAIAAEEEKNRPAKSTTQAATPPATKQPHDTHSLLKAHIVNANATGIEELLQQCLDEGAQPTQIIEGPLMEAMNTVGELFAEGRLFLPQVVKSAQTMRQAVDFLTPLLETTQNSASHAGRMVLATVKGDVHDIGKNIVSVIMRCNGWEVIDIGVMQPAETIVNTAIEHKANAIGVSGLITPSLNEMINVAALMQQKGLHIPLFVGGATTSALHTAVKIAPTYTQGVVAHTAEAASMPPLAHRLTGYNAAENIRSLKEEQHHIVTQYQRSEADKHNLTVEEARKRRLITHSPSPAPALTTALMDITVEQAAPFINWRAFLKAWNMPPALATYTLGDACPHCIASAPEELQQKAPEALTLVHDAKNEMMQLIRENATIKARVEILPATTQHETITATTHAGETIRINTPRQLKPQPQGQPQLALADFLAPQHDHVGFFAVTTAGTIAQKIEQLKTEGNEYRAILLQTLADRLAEAATEVMHHRVRTTIWAYSPNDILEPANFMNRDFQGIRPAVGYPSLPEQSTIFILDKVLDYISLGIMLTETGAMYPPASTTGLIFASPHARYFAT